MWRISLIILIFIRNFRNWKLSLWFIAYSKGVAMKSNESRFFIFLEMHFFFPVFHTAWCILETFFEGSHYSIHLRKDICIIKFAEKQACGSRTTVLSGENRIPQFNSIWEALMDEIFSSRQYEEATITVSPYWHLCTF